MVFVPAGAVHGTTNVGEKGVRLHAVFTSTIIEMEMLQRNPAPGTEDRPPSHVEYDEHPGHFCDVR